MNANELRIGNWVNYTDTNLTPMKVMGIPVNYLEEHMQMITTNKNETVLEDFEPIPLTPEILDEIEKENNKTRIGTLTRAGQSVQWEFNYQKIYLDEYGIFHYITEADDFGNYIDGIKLTSLHQLQNLYFALTGEELKVNFHVEAGN